LNLLTDSWLDLASIDLRVIEELEDVAVLNDTAQVGALGDSLLEGWYIPAVDEVSVVSVTSLIAVGEDKGVLAIDKLVGELRGIPDNLVEEGDEALGVRVGANAVVDAIRVGHVRLVVGRIEVLAIPARWEEDLGTETVGAVDVGDLVGLLGVGSKAGKADGTLLQGVGEGTEHRISRKHTETLWEGEQALVVLWVLGIGTLAINW
jgi:hypothetical protein